MNRKIRPVVRLTVAVVALIALALSGVQAGLTLAEWRGASADVPPWAAVSRILVVLAWGVGFAGLSLVVTWRVGHRREVLVAGLFLAVYALWAGLGRNPLVQGEPWLRPALFVIDGLAHSIGIRFTQLFPRPLTVEGVRTLGRGWSRKVVSPLLGALTRPRIFWPFALVLEVFGRSGVVPGAYYVHVILWLALGATYLFAGYRLGSREDRQRIFWIMEGVAVFLVVELGWFAMWSVDALGVLSFDVSFWSAWQSVVEAWATLVCFALAIFHSGAFDSGLILRKTTVLGAAGTLAVVVFIALETTVGEMAVAMLGVDTRIADIAIGVIAALAFRPLSERIDRIVRRWTGSQSAAQNTTSAGLEQAKGSTVSHTR